MPSEIKQRKKLQSQKQNDETQQVSPANRKDDTPKAKTEDGENSGAKNPTSSLDVKSFMCLSSLIACGVSSWLVSQQNERFSSMEEKYRFLHGKTSSSLDMEEEMVKVSKKLAASEDDLHKALATVSTATRLQQDISALHDVVMAMQADENSASRDSQAVNARFLNVTETWQERSAGVASDSASSKAEAREAHAGATEQVNEAEQRARASAKRSEESEDSTKRNARVSERTEEEDAKRAQDHSDWNTQQIHKSQEQISSLAKREAELNAELQDHIPRARQCEEQSPQVEEAVRSISKSNSDLSGAERRLEEVTSQVFGTEDSMSKASSEISEIRQESDTSQAQNSISKMKNESSVVKEAVRELTMVSRGNDDGSQADSGTLEDEEWRDEDEEPWSEDESSKESEPPHDDVIE